MNPTQPSLITATAFHRWWFPTAVAVFIFCGIFAVIIPTTEGIISTREKITQNQQTLTQLQSQLQSISAVNDNDLNLMSSTVDSALPDSKPLFEVLSQLQSVAATTGVILGDYDLNPGSMASGTAAEKSNTQQIALATSIAVKGTYDQINSFLTSLNNLLPLFTVTEVNIKPENQDKVSATLSIEIYYEPIKADIAKNKVALKIDDKIKQTIATVQTYQGVDAANASSSSVINFDRQDIFNF